VPGDKLARYRRADRPLPDRHLLWPLYSAGLENLGDGGRMAQAPLPRYGPGELLVRHDACSLCFSDVKVIQLGPQHPRIHRDMRADPVVLGHEVSVTVVGVGRDLRDSYRVGNRFVVQPDIYASGAGHAYGYEIQGGLSQYGVIDQRVLDGDGGNYLIPIPPAAGYAEAALAEPWACVLAAYRLTYRTGLKPGGTAWIVGAPGSPSPAREGDRDYALSAGLDEDSHPSRLLLTGVPASFAAWLRARAAWLGVEVIEAADITAPPATPVDDIVLLGADPGVVEAVGPHLANSGILALLVGSEPLRRRVAVDVGRVHYNRWLYVAGTSADVAQAYGDTPVRSSLKPGGRAWFLGAGGPMGRMHVQHALQVATGPATVVCTDVSDQRLADLRATFVAEAEAGGIDFTCLNPSHGEAYEMGMAPFREPGFDDVVVLAPDPAAIADAAAWLAPGGVMNIFAGVARGTVVELDLGDLVRKGLRVIGHSGSTVADLQQMLDRVASGALSPNRSVAAVGSLGAARNGLQAVQDAAFAGKIVLYPHIREMPLTALPDLKDALPSVHARLKDGCEWTNEAEAELLRRMLAFGCL
jgi:threonine dehydrogenase-like Zn-dependent dehydrogenase